MKPEPISIQDLRELINKGEARDPLVFLESVMNGQDPRRLSSIYELICEIDSFTNGELSKSDWAEIVDHVSSRYKYHTVSLGDSLAASKTLAEYLHAKRKQVELNTSDSNSENNHLTPLSKEEVETMVEWFDEDYM